MAANPPALSKSNLKSSSKNHQMRSSSQNQGLTAEPVDESPLLGHSIADNILRSRRFIRHPPQTLRGAARFLRRASGRRMMLREPSVLVRETAAEQLEERQSDWAYSKPIIVLDILWNLAFAGVGFTVLSLSLNENPSVPLRLWIIGYALQSIVHMSCVLAEYRLRRRARLVNSNGSWESGADSNSFSGSDGEDYAMDEQQNHGDPGLTKHIMSANTMFSFIWWIVGFYWVTAGGESLTSDSPQLYWLCITFLAFDVVFVLICVAIACLVGIAVCCCLPCIIAILYAVTDQDGATMEEINQLPKYKFHRQVDTDKVDGEIQESMGGIMTECSSDSPIERPLSQEDAECCICLCAYDNGTELRQLPCNHHFHSSCVDKWLHINATCPLCKYNILKQGDQSSTEQV